jgi:hypothetical protein
MSYFPRTGDIVRRKPGTCNGVYLAQVKAVRNQSDFDVAVTKVITRGSSGTIHVGQRLHSLPGSYFTLETPRGAVTGRMPCSEPNLSNLPGSPAVIEGLQTAVAAGAEEIRRLQEEVSRLQGALQRSESAYEGHVRVYRQVVKNRNHWRDRAVKAERQAATYRGMSGEPRSVLVVLTPPQIEPSENPPRGSSRLVADADLVIAAAVDDSYVKVLKSRLGGEPDIKVVWER